MIAEDLAVQLQASPLINAIVAGTRIFYKQPQNADELKNEQNYLTFARSSSTESAGCTTENEFFQFTCFSKSMLELENIAEAVKGTFRGNNKVFNGNVYYVSQLVSRVDSINKLDDGFYWAILTYEFRSIVS